MLRRLLRIFSVAIIIIIIFFFFDTAFSSSSHQTQQSVIVRGISNPSPQDRKTNNGDNIGKREIIEVKDDPHDVVWVVQLSDLHFSVHHPDRALDFNDYVAPALSMINPSLVLLTGDLTDGKSKDLLIMKQNEEEWVEYQHIMETVIERSGLKKNIFYDLRGNHDNFGVPTIGGSLDFFSKYSINGQLGRNGPVNSVTIQTNERELLFIGIDSAMTLGLRGPTNLFGHPTDQLLAEIESELAQWDSISTKPTTKVSFGHFPLSFSAAASSGKSLKDIFLKHSVSAYLCGHLHKKFGKNLKRHHHLDHQRLSFYQKLFQLNAHQIPLKSTNNCSNADQSIQEFWEWEMADWRKNRAMRIFAVDRGYISFVDTDFESGAKETIILPTFPLDSRFMLTTLSPDKYKCESLDPLSYASLRALIFSVSPIVSVVARIFDTRPGNFHLVMETTLGKHESTSSRGDLYTAPWNFNAFEDPSPDRFWMQIEATDITGRSTVSERRPFSINGLSAKLTWTWKEFFVMGCQWATLYYPLLWSFLLIIFSILLIPKVIFTFRKNCYTYKQFIANKGFIPAIAWVSTELYGIPFVWLGLLCYLLNLIVCPWLYGEVFTDGSIRGYMTYKGWVLNSSGTGKLNFIGFPDVMVVVLPHLLFVVLPAITVIGALAAERAVYREIFLALSGKKEDDYGNNDEGRTHEHHLSDRSRLRPSKRWIRKFLLLVSLAICWKHIKNCNALMKAYTMNPFLHFPIYSFSIPLLLACAVYKTRKV